MRAIVPNGEGDDATEQTGAFALLRILGQSGRQPTNDCRAHRQTEPPFREGDGARLSETPTRPHLFEPGWERASAPAAREAIAYSRLPK